jgi:cyclopropane-fatty-acyl-phospholipid synthase
MSAQPDIVNNFYEGGMSNFYLSFLQKLTNAHYGHITINTPDNRRLCYAGKEKGVDCEITLKTWSAIDAVIKRGDIGLGEAYMRGEWSSPDVVAFLSYCSLNKDALALGSSTWYQRLLFRLYNNWVRINNKMGSKKNISAHYDISNDFYRLWLDETMTYSSGLRVSNQDDLATAQRNKYQRIIDRLGLKNKQILEIGCGWGGFMAQACEQGNFVTGLTISKDQFDYANKRLREQTKAKIKFQDYRDEKQRYDAIVSIEMFEAVGERYWPTYFQAIKRCLRDNGKALIQTITIADNIFKNYRKDSDFIRHYIFPGGMLPSKAVFVKQAQKAGLSVNDVHEFGLDYAWTLREWLKRFDAVTPVLLEQGYQESFINMWRFYFYYCIAGFETERINVMQIELSHQPYL